MPAPPNLPSRNGRPLAGLLQCVGLAGGALAGAWRRGAGAGLTERAMDWLQPGRGRRARSPAEIPLKGWRDILWRTWRSFNRDQIATVAGGISFFGLLAAFPGLAAFVSLYGLFADVHDAVKLIEALAVVAPHDAVVFIGAQMIRISEQRPSTLSTAFLVSLGLSIWSANAGVKALFNGLTVAYGEREKRGYLRRTLSTLLFTLAGLGLMLVYIGALVAIPLLLPGIKRVAPWLDLLRWPVLLGLTMMVLAVVYRYGPSREHARWRWITWGSAVAAALWLLASLAFAWYVSSLAHFDRTYGSFGAAAGAMIWWWMSVVIVLLGAELNAEIEHQTSVDSTTGPPRPLGARGAMMADTIGKARRD
jgi:membrane protein